MKIALLGYGKMGKTIEQIAQQRGHEIVTRIGRSDSMSTILEADVVIEFTTPDSAVTNLKRVTDLGLPVVCGTTGWNDELNEVTDYIISNNGALVHASNFSLGVNIFFEINRQLAVLMNPYTDYHTRIEETHHTQKKDAPSGTAVSIAQDIIKNNKQFNTWHLGVDELTNSLPIHAKRKADVKGTHKVIYNNNIDTISISHKAHSRDGFALGAIVAAEWVLNKKGIFTMKDVLQLSN